MLTGYQGMGLLFSSRRQAINAAVEAFLTCDGGQSEAEGLTGLTEDEAREMLPGYIRGQGIESEVEAEQAAIDEELIAEVLRRKAGFEAGTYAPSEE